jgi:RimJ/RimL family protein N-acetyltransferase
VSWPPRPLRTDRLVVRAVTPDDVEAIVVLLTDPDVRRHLGGPVDDDTVAAVRAGPIGQRWGVFGIVDVSTSELVGTVSLDRERDGELEISYQLLHQRWGAGLASEAVSAVIDWAWSTTQDRSVIAVTQAANERSVRLLDRLGFVAEREMIEHGERQVLLRLSAPAPLTDR